MKYPELRPVAELLDETGEPFFLIRAQDSLAPMAVLLYAAIAKQHGLDVLSQQVGAVAVQFAEWQSAHPELVKQPD